MKPRQIGQVVFWMTGVLLSFCVLAVSVRGLAGVLNSFEILSIRSGLSLAILAAILAARPRLRRDIAARRMGLHLARNTSHFVGQLLWTLGLTMLPLAMVFALEFSMPAWTTILGALFMRERLTASRLGVIAFGIAGVLVILRPGVEGLQIGALIVLAAAFGFATSLAFTKSLTVTETTISIIVWMNVMQLPMGLMGAESLLFVQKLGPEHILPALGMGLGNLTAHLCFSNAMRVGDMAVVVPMDFLRIPLIAVVGWWFFNESVDAFVFLGAGIIVTGVIWNLYAEAARRPTLPDGPTPGSAPG